MSNYSDCLNQQFSMCPCTGTNDIPREKPGINEGSQEVVEPGQGETGFELLSGDSGSDEEQDTLEGQGYLPLAQNEEESNAVGIEQVDQEMPDIVNEPDEKPAEIAVETEIEAGASVSESQSSSSVAFSSTRGSQMGEDEVDLIKSIMTNVKIPSSSIPEWAKKIPEEKWKAPLVTSIRQRNPSEDTFTDKKSS